MADAAVILGTLCLIALIAKVGSGALVSFTPPKNVPTVDLDPRNLPYYAARSTLRMFIALIASFAFTFLYGYAAARSRYAEKVLIPLLDVLQSVPVLGFLSITITGFMALFPGSLLGLECASIFAIFTAQAWNMAFSFYQSLVTLPQDLTEVSAAYRLPLWQRFTRLEVPAGMIGLIWNAMMSFGGSWFFLAASEAITVLNQSYTLPGIGSYVAEAVTAQNMPALGWALLTMAITIVIIDQLFWRPIVAWADKFRMEQSASASAPQSWVYDLIRTARIPAMVSRAWDPIGDALGSLLSRLTRFRAPRTPDPREVRFYDGLYTGSLLVVVAALLGLGVHVVLTTVGVAEVIRVAGLGLATLARVVVLLIFASVVWTPIGIMIGMSPRLTRFLQPVALFCASFPANLVFPFATLAFIKFHVPINLGSILLMALGAQWYILFNAIAGGASIPTDLREMAADIGAKRWLKWRRLVLPAAFSSWVTGGITASGGAWNASIVSEIVSWGHTTLTATGLGAYITDATGKGDWPRITLGVGMMSIYVVAINRLVWRRLYALAEAKYHL